MCFKRLFNTSKGHTEDSNTTSQGRKNCSNCKKFYVGTIQSKVFSVKGDTAVIKVEAIAYFCSTVGGAYTLMSAPFLDTSRGYTFGVPNIVDCFLWEAE